MILLLLLSLQMTEFWRLSFFFCCLIAKAKSKLVISYQGYVYIDKIITITFTFESHTYDYIWLKVSLWHDYWLLTLILLFSLISRERLTGLFYIFLSSPVYHSVQQSLLDEGIFGSIIHTEYIMIDLVYQQSTYLT